MSGGAGMHQHAEAPLRKGQGHRTRRFVSQLLQLGNTGRYPLLFALGLCGGAAWYMSVWYEPSLIILSICAIIALIVAALVLGRLSLPPVMTAAVVILTGVACGAISGKLATLRVSHPIITQPLGPVMLEGWVEDVEPSKRGVRLRLIVHAIDDLPSRALPARVRVTHTTRLEVEAGRFVRCWAVLRPPPGPIIRGDYAFDRQAWFEGLGAVGYVQGRCRGGSLGLPQNRLDRASLWVAKHRRNLAHYVEEAAGDRAGGFAAALASGDRSFMSAKDQDALRGSGLAHLLAISGLHMGIVGGLVYILVWRGLALIEPIALRIPVQKPAAAAALIASLSYLVLSGASVSTQRAFIMAAVLFGAVLVDRVALSLRSLAIAMIIVVVLSPWSVLTPGFQMSFAATGALIATYEAWQRRRRETGQVSSKGVSFWLKSLVVTSTVSSLATMPFALYHFDRIAGLGLIANLLAMPIISLVTAPMAALAMLTAPFGLAHWPLRGFGYSLEGVLWVAHTFDIGTGGGTRVGKSMPETALLALVAALTMAIMLAGWRKRTIISGGFVAVAAILWAFNPAARIHWSPSGDIFIVDRSGHVDRYQLSNEDGLAPLRYTDIETRSNCTTDACTARLHDIDIQLLPSTKKPTCVNTQPGEIIFSAGAGREDLNCERRLLTWTSQTAMRGESWRIADGQLIPIHKPPCGARPWITCTE